MNNIYNAYIYIHVYIHIYIYIYEYNYKYVCYMKQYIIPWKSSLDPHRRRHAPLRAWDLRHGEDPQLVDRGRCNHALRGRVGKQGPGTSSATGRIVAKDAMRK